MLGVELYPTAIFPYDTLMFKFCIIHIATSRPTAGHSVSMTAKRCAVCTARNDYSKEREQVDKLGVASTKWRGCMAFCARHAAAAAEEVSMAVCVMGNQCNWWKRADSTMRAQEVGNMKCSAFGTVFTVILYHCDREVLVWDLPWAVVFFTKKCVNSYWFWLLWHNEYEHLILCINCIIWNAFIIAI